MRDSLNWGGVAGLLFLSHMPGLKTNYKPTHPKSTVLSCPCLARKGVDRSRVPRSWGACLGPRALLWRKRFFRSRMGDRENGLEFGK